MTPLHVALLLCASPAAGAALVPDMMLRVKWEQRMAVYGATGMMRCHGEVPRGGEYVGSCSKGTGGEWLGGNSSGLFALYGKGLGIGVEAGAAQFTFPIAKFGTGAFGNRSFPERSTKLRLEILDGRSYAGPVGPFDEYSVSWPQATSCATVGPNATTVASIQKHCGTIGVQGCKSDLGPAPLESADVTIHDRDVGPSDDAAVFHVPLRSSFPGSRWWTKAFVVRVTSPDALMEVFGGMCPISVTKCGFGGVSVACPGVRWGDTSSYHLSVKLTGDVKLELQDTEVPAKDDEAESRSVGIVV